MTSPGASVVRIGEDAGRAALLVDGVVQSISPEDGLATGGYWAAMLPTVRPTRALILGMGGGTLARLIHARWGADVRIVGVDDDLAILETARAAGWLPETGMQVVVGDAFEFVSRTPERFDYIAVDLFRGPRIAPRVFGKPFLRRVREVLTPRGWLVMNLFRDRREAHRVERVAALLEVRECKQVGGNVVVHAQKRT